VLDAETIPFVDVTAARMLAALAADLRRRDIELLLARDPALRRVYPSVHAAVEAAKAGAPA
jgi:SulP family sulfate permease